MVVTVHPARVRLRSLLVLSTVALGCGRSGQQAAGPDGGAESKSGSVGLDAGDAVGMDTFPAGTGGGDVGSAGGASGRGGSGGDGYDGGQALPPHPCQGAFRTPTAPVLVDASLECQDGGFDLHVAFGAGERTYVGLTTNAIKFVPRLFTIDLPASIQVEAPGVPNNPAWVFTDPAGAPFLAEGEVQGVGIGSFKRSGTAWTLEPVSSPPGRDHFPQVGGARFAADGRAFIAYTDGAMTINLGTRDLTGAWQHKDVGLGVNPALVIDSQQRAHVIYLAQNPNDPKSSLTDWRDGTSPRVLWSGVIGVILSSFSTTALPSGAIASSLRVLDGGIHVLIASADGAGAIDVPVPGSTQAAVPGCPPLYPCSMIGGSTTCTEKGDQGIGSQVVAADGAGRLWLAHVVAHFDRDVKHTTTIGEAAQCMQSVTADRSTYELVLEAVPLDGQAAPTIGWRAPLAALVGSVAMEAKGTKLTLTFGVDETTKSVVRYLVLDTAQL